jgi:hypothetical protein
MRNAYALRFMLCAFKRNLQQKGMIFSKPLHLATYTILTLLLSFHIGFAQNSFKIFLVGDAGDHEESGETLINLRKELLGNPNSAVVFLGDNSYKNILWGLIPVGYKGFDSTRNTIEKLIPAGAAGSLSGIGFFYSGKPDWWNRLTYERGRPKLAMEEAFISKNLAKNSALQIREMCFCPKMVAMVPIL